MARRTEAWPANVLRAIKSGPVPVLRDTTGLRNADLTRGERVVRFIESYLVVPEGDLVGKPVRLDYFQKAFVLAVYDNPAGTRVAILSEARKNAKTATIAFLLLATLVGPEAMQNSRVVSGAMSRDQAAEVYNLAAKCAALSPALAGIVHSTPSGKVLTGLRLNTEYKALSAESTTAHGKSPRVAILDEVGQVKGPRSDFIDAITTAQGAYSDPLLIYISTQAAGDGDLLSILIDDATQNKPASTVCHVYAAEPGADVMDPEAWAAANPALGKFRSLEDLRAQAERAARTPSFENTFRNLCLNQRVSTVSPFVSRDVWLSNGGAAPPMAGRRVWAGLDLSARLDLTAAIFVDEEGHVWPMFWAPAEGLQDRAHRDRVPYDVWARQGHLRLTPGRSVDYGFAVRDIAEATGGAEVVAVGFDRWRIDLFRRELELAGLSLPLVPHGQGFRDMAPALDRLEGLLLDGRLRHGGHPVLTMCAANATTTVDSAGNRKLDKVKATGRIDGMVALAMAVAVRAGPASGADAAGVMDFLRNPVTT